MASNSVKLRSGASMPLLGLGTVMYMPWEDALTQEEKNKVVIDSILNALEIGYRHFDTAFIYLNETAIGKALETAFQRGIVKREDIFITTKLPPNGLQPDKVQYFLKKSLANLKVSYVDLYLVHLPIAFKYTSDAFDGYPTPEGVKANLENVDLLETWKAMEACVDAGLVRDIGVSNFNSEQVKRVYDNARIKPSNNQVECHVYLQQEKLYNFCKQLGVTLTAYSSFGSSMKLNPILDDKVLTEISKKYSKTTAQVIVRWLIQRGIIAIPKSANPVRMEQNFKVFDFNLTEEDMKAIKALDSGTRLFALDHAPGMAEHPEYPYKIEF